jgi:hypothetical protein
MDRPGMMSDAYVGTSWRGASGDVATVERVECGIAYGRWRSGILWSEHVDLLDKLYARAPAIPADVVDGGDSVSLTVLEEALKEPESVAYARILRLVREARA